MTGNFILTWLSTVWQVYFSRCQRVKSSYNDFSDLHWVIVLGWFHSLSRYKQNKIKNGGGHLLSVVC